MATSLSIAKNRSSQKGATLIVALVLLAVMTTLGFTSLRSTNIQQTIINNSQFLTAARNVALNEINTHINLINSNPPFSPDDSVTDLLDSPLTIIPITPTAGTAYSQSFSATIDNDNYSVPGYSLGGPVNGVQITIQSRAALNSTAAVSAQSQGYLYIKPSGSI